MIEVGKSYKLKKIKSDRINNVENTFKVLAIKDGTVYCQDEDTEEYYIFRVTDLIDPEKPDDIYSDLQIVFEKLTNVMYPMNLSFWKKFEEDVMASTAAAVPALASGGLAGGTGMDSLGPVATSYAGARVNGVPVEGRSVKNKKKKKKKNESIRENEQILNLTDLINLVEEGFDPYSKLVTAVPYKKENIKIIVSYTNPDDKVLTLRVKIKVFDKYTFRLLDEFIEEDLTIRDTVEILTKFNTDLDNNELNDLINKLQEEFHEDYEFITDLLAKQLDRMNFEYANTEDIVYKKEGENYKYLLKFDNNLGILKFKVFQGDKIVIDKEWNLDIGEDITPIFNEIEEIYERLGL